MTDRPEEMQLQSRVFDLLERNRNIVVSAWTPATHGSMPIAFQRTIMTLMLIRRFHFQSAISVVPAQLMYKILNTVAAYRDSFTITQSNLHQSNSNPLRESELLRSLSDDITLSNHHENGDGSMAEAPLAIVGEKRKRDHEPIDLTSSAESLELDAKKPRHQE